MSSIRKSWLSSSVFLIVGSVLSAAQAQTQDDDAKRSSALRAEATAAGEQKDWTKCVAKATQAWKLQKSPLTSGVLGFCEAEIGQNASSAQHLAYSLRLDDVAAHRALTSAKLDEVKKRVASLEVKVEPQGGVLRVNGDERPLDGTTIYVEPGHASVEATKEGFESKVIALEVVAGSSTPVTIALTAKQTSTTPPPDSKKAVWPGVVLGSVSLVGIGVGIGGVVASAKASSSADDRAAQYKTEKKYCTGGCPELQSDLNHQKTLRGVGIAGFSVGGAALVGTIIYLAIPARKAKASPTGDLHLIPVLGTSNGFSLTGQF